MSHSESVAWASKRRDILFAYSTMPNGLLFRPAYYLHRSIELVFRLNVSLPDLLFRSLYYLARMFGYYVDRLLNFGHY